MLKPFTAEQASAAYRRYQAQAGVLLKQGRIPACRSQWDTLSEPTRALLTNPLYLYLFMETFDRRLAEAVTTLSTLFRRYVERAMTEHPGLDASVTAVIEWLLPILAVGAALEAQNHGWGLFNRLETPCKRELGRVSTGLAG